jgi:hypothetical protein
MPDLTLERMISAVQKQKSQNPAPEPMQPPCPEAEIGRLRRSARERLGTDLPERYLDLLRITNGLEENGVTVYGNQEARNVASDVIGRELTMPGLIEENETMRLDRPNYIHLIVFAYSALYVHALDIATGKYVFFPHVGSQPDEAYDTFDQMMISTLWLALNEEFRPDPWKQTRPRW